MTKLGLRASMIPLLVAALLAGTACAPSDGEPGDGENSGDQNDAVNAATACTANGVAGTCIATSACAAKSGFTSTPGHCPGAASIECCTQEAAPTACKANGVAGTCISTSACAAMSGFASTPGLCPGAADIECCTESAAPPPPPPPPPTGCPVLAFPSGIHIQTVANAAMTASYANHLESGQTAPPCFIDVTDLQDPVAGTTYDMTVHVAANFELSELVGTEVDQGYGNLVLLDPKAVASLQAFREAVGESVSVNSGFRGPKHQEATCESLCGAISCPGTCALYSEHMWGNAFDLPMSFYNTTDTNLACDAGFMFTYLEAGTHLHIDQNPAYTSCVHE